MTVISASYSAFKFGYDPDASVWFSPQTVPEHTGTLKLKPYDLEHPTVRLGVSISDDTKGPGTWTHLLIDNIGQGLVYKILAVRQGPARLDYASPGSYQPATGIVEADLELDMLATMYQSARFTSTYWADADITLTGRWERLPLPGGPLEQFQLRPSQMHRDRIATRLPHITEKAGGTLPILFVKITAQVSDALTHFGTFCTVENSSAYLDAHLCSSNNQFYIYPSLYAVMNELPLMLGIDSKNIVDVSISEDCPFAYSFSSGAGYQGRDIIATSASGASAWLHNFEVGGNTYHIMMYSLPNMIIDWKETTLTLQFKDSERLMGQLQLIGSDNSVVSVIDPRYAAYNAVTERWEIDFTYRCKVDCGSMYSELQYPDGTVLRFNEGHLPWVGSAWADYVAVQRNYDRSVNIIEKDKAQTEMVGGIATSLANGMFTSAFNGGLGAATAALGAVGTVGNWYEGERARGNMQDAKEGLMKATPGTVYSPEYGVSYANIMANAEAFRQIVVAMPIGVTDAELTSYCAHRGYPVTDYGTSIKYSDLIDAAEGFLKAVEVDGVAFSGTITDPTYGWKAADGMFPYGEYRRILERQLKKGVHFKKIS